MPNNSKTYILDDQWTDIDALDFMPYVETLADIIQTGNTPLTIGVFGTWGSGKTSLMRMVKKQMPNDFTVAWFDAWKYDKEDSLWRAFLLCVLNALKERASLQGKPVEEFEKMQSLIYRDMEIEKVGGVTIDLAKLGGFTAKGLAQLSLSFIPGISALTKLVEELQSGAANSVDEATAAIRRERTKIYIEQIQFLEQFQNRFRELIQMHVKPNRFIVFIDDLDRCLPEKAIEVLEAIKLFLDVENCLFMLGLDQTLIVRGIEIKYKDLRKTQDGNIHQNLIIEGERYLEKIIQLPFHIPPMERKDISDFIESLTDRWPDVQCAEVFAEGLGDNPRRIKRTVNMFLMLWALYERRKAKLMGHITPIRLAKVVVIQAAYPELYRALKVSPNYLIELENYFRQLDIVPTRSKNDPKAKKIMLPDALTPFGSDMDIRKILTMHKTDLPNANFCDLTSTEINSYFTLTRRVEPDLTAFQIAWQEALEMAGEGSIKMRRSRAGLSKEQEDLINRTLEKRLPTGGD